MAKPSREDAKDALVRQAVKTGAAMKSGDAAKAAEEADKLALMKRLIDNGPK